MDVRVLVFGPERAALGSDRIGVTLSGDPSCAALRAALAEHAPALRPYLPGVRFAVNHRFVPDSHQLRETDEVAMIGMVSGG